MKAVIAPFKYPRSVKFVDALPKTESGKIQRFRPAREGHGMSDIFARTRELFHMPQGVLYLDGNSLGPLPKAAAARVASTIQEEWGGELIRGWNTAGWIDLPSRVGDRIGRLIGAPAGTVVTGDTLVRSRSTRRWPPHSTCGPTARW